LSDDGAIHGLAWACWLGVILLIVTLSRNPWYLGLALVWVSVVDAFARRRPLLGRVAPLWSPLRFGLVVIPLTAFFNFLTVHVGTTVLVRLPASWPVIGGALTLEALVYGALNGLALTCIFAAFAVVNRVVSLRALIQLIPRTYYPVAVITAIAVTFVPATLYHWQQIREAQAVRGHRLRGLRSWLPLWLPLLTGGLERALQLAEAMTARGFAGGPAHYPAARLMLLAAGLLAVLGGLLVRLIGAGDLWSSLLMVGGGGAVLWVLRAAGRQHPHTRYRPMPWRGRDWVVVGGALITATVWLLPLPGRSTIFFTPYPTLTLPALALSTGIALWGLLAPAAVWLAMPPPVEEGAGAGGAWEGEQQHDRI
jgi:energy-coupling factor transport system permease protein